MSRLRDESGIAIIVVLLAVMVVSGLGAALTISATRDLDTSGSTQRSSSALAVAEAGVQHAIQQLKTTGPLLSGEIADRIKDDSNDGPAYPFPNGRGVWMNKANPKVPPPPFDPADPDNKPGPYEGHVGPTGKYTVYVVQVDPVDVVGKRPGVYRIVSTGLDNRNNPERPGLTTVQQEVRISVLEIPFSMYSQTTLGQNGTPTLRNISIWAGENVFHRSGTPPKPKFEAAPAGYPNSYDPTGTDPTKCRWATGCDLFYTGHDLTKPDSNPLCPASPDPCRLPATVHSKGTIYKGGVTATKDQIHPPAESSGCGMPFDRDNLGGPYPSPWPCTLAGPQPPYPTSGWAGSCKDTASDVGSCLKRFPFNPDLPNEDTYRQLRSMAKATGTYCRHDTSATLAIADPPPDKSCKDDSGADVPLSTNIQSLKAQGKKFFVLYVEGKAGAGAVDINASWGSQDPVPENVQPGDPACGSMGIVVVRNASVKWNNTKNWWGALFIPEGDLSGSGVGGGWIIGTVKSKSIDNAGNIKIQLNPCWQNSIPGFNFSVERLRWHEIDR